MRNARLVLLGVLALPAAAGAQTPVLSEELLVNAVTTTTQRWPSVANVGPDGNFVVVWQDYSGANGDGWEVRGRLFGATGTPLEEEFRVNVATANHQGLAQVASNADGAFVVVWSDYTTTGLGWNVFARRFDSSGAPQGGDIPVNTYTTGIQGLAQVGLDDAGNFVVVWQSTDQDGSEAGIFGQRFDSAGNKVGGEFRVNQVTTDQQSSPAVARRPNGEFLVTWESYQDLQTLDIMGRRFATDGTPFGGDFRISSAETNNQFFSDVAYGGDGTYVVVWNSTDGSGRGVYGQRLESSGARLGPEFNVNTYTTGFQSYPQVAAGPDGEFAVIWDSPNQDGSGHGVFAQMFEATGRRSGVELPVNSYTSGFQVVPSITAQPNGQFVTVWQGAAVHDSDSGISARLMGFPETRPIAVDALHAGIASGGSNHNGVLEVNETAAVEPAFRNNSSDPLPLTGSIVQFYGPAGATYTLLDDQADYGTIPPDGTNDCVLETGDCYQIQVTGARPAAHWDALMDEQISYEDWGRTAALHIGGSFPDVPQNLFYPFIETLLHQGVTGGCGGGNYCPLDTVTRAQMSVFLLKSRWGSGFLPPAATGTAFTDVPASHPFARWIEELVREGITAGCGSGMYCPDNPVTRQQMAVFLLKTKYGASYLPPPGTGIFGDVSPCPGVVCNFIEDLYDEGITGGCSASPLLYCPGSPNLRQQMAAFLTKTFGLELYGP